VVETTRQESQVILRMTSVIARPMIGSAIRAPSADGDRGDDDAERDEALERDEAVERDGHLQDQ
jgi:hypothetical protein